MSQVLAEFGQTLSSPHDLRDILGFPDSIQSALILAELAWGGRRRSEFYGFEILCRLRTEHRLRCPIAVCSFTPELALRKQFPVLDFPQHPFIRLPANPSAIITTLSTAPPADEPRLNHILMYCDLYGRLERLLTHGRGFPIFVRAVEESTPDAQGWRNLRSDSDLLRKYLRGGALEQEITEKGNNLITALDAACRAEDSEKLREARACYMELRIALRDVKRI